MERKKNFFDKIGRFIPGYKGYTIREEKRNTDKKLRDILSSKIANSEKEIISSQQHLISKKELKSCEEWELVRKSLNTLQSKIKFAPYGESSFFSENQLKETELDQIHELDLSISESIDQLYSTIENQNRSFSSPDVNHLIKNIENMIQGRSQFIQTFK
jgi:hypothetical protein